MRQPQKQPQGPSAQSAAQKGSKLLKQKSAQNMAVKTASKPNAASNAKVQELEKELSERNKGLDVALIEVREARVEVEALKGKLAEANRYAFLSSFFSVSDCVQEGHRGGGKGRGSSAQSGRGRGKCCCRVSSHFVMVTRCMQVRLEQMREQKEAAEAEAAVFNGADYSSMSLNEVRDAKHKIKAALEAVTAVMNQKKMCPSCEAAVKECIIVPCLHAFCHKCGEKNKKQIKCSICNVAPERIYLLSGKKN